MRAFHKEKTDTSQYAFSWTTPPSLQAYLLYGYDPMGNNETSLEDIGRHQIENII